MLIHILETPGLNEDCPEEYIGKSILPAVLIPDIQYEVKNQICFQVDLIEDMQYNNIMKTANITFMVFCETRNINTKYGIARHDLLGYLIKDLFNWSNIFGCQAKLIYDRESVVDSNFSCRTIKYELKSTNSIVKLNSNNNPYVFNNVVQK